MTTELTLKPCPFCGSPFVSIHRQEHHVEAGDGESSVGWQVACENCYCATHESEETREAAIETWNRRVQPIDLPLPAEPVPCYQVPIFVHDHFHNTTAVSSDSVEKTLTPLFSFAHDPPQNGDQRLVVETWPTSVCRFDDLSPDRQDHTGRYLGWLDPDTQGRIDKANLIEVVRMNGHLWWHFSGDARALRIGDWEKFSSKYQLVKEQP